MHLSSSRRSSRQIRAAGYITYQWYFIRSRGRATLVHGPFICRYCTQIFYRRLHHCATRLGFAVFMTNWSTIVSVSFPCLRQDILLPSNVQYDQSYKRNPLFSPLVIAYKRRVACTTLQSLCTNHAFSQ